MGQKRSFYDRCDDYHQVDVCGQCGCRVDECGCRKQHEPEGALVEKVVCSKDVQKTAEFLVPAAIGPLGGGSMLDPTALLGAIGGLLGITGTIANITVTPNYDGIQQEVTVIKDKVINLGFVPATLDVEVLGAATVSTPIRIFFQEHTDCPGACPGDQVIETRPKVEATFSQPLIGTVDGGTVVNLLLFKAILRTHITVVRRGIKRNGKICDIDPCSCDPNASPIVINSPQNVSKGSPLIGGAGGGGTPPA